MTWTRNGQAEFIRVARAPRANSDRVKPPAVGPVRLSRIQERLCDRCPELFKINSRSEEKLCPGCAEASELTRRGRVQRVRAAMVSYEAEKAAAGLSPHEELQRVLAKYRVLNGGLVVADPAARAQPSPGSLPGVRTTGPTSAE